jgi:hypothetical protein
MKTKTTALALYADDRDAILTGEEIYPIIGDGDIIITPDELISIQANLAGFNRYWNCLEKAWKTYSFLEAGELTIGTMLVWNEGHRSNYGFYYNPPLEFHAWLAFPGGRILDVALPGVIERGLWTFDEVGAAIVNRVPVVLAGIPPDWLEYRAKEIWRVT